MCNPRRVRVKATRQLAEAWDHEVRRQVTLGGRAVGRAAVREQVADRLGRPVLATLDDALAGLDGWQAVDDGYRIDLDGGYAQYHSDTGELEIVAELAEDIQAQGEAAATVRAEVEALIEAQGTGRYYDDGWGGLTEQTARRDAEADAQRALERVAAERTSQAKQAAESGAGQQVRARAEAAAQEAWPRPPLPGCSSCSELPESASRWSGYRPGAGSTRPWPGPRIPRFWPTRVPAGPRACASRNVRVPSRSSSRWRPDVRYKVEFHYREDTGEIELLQVEVVEGPSGRAADHDAQHDRVTGEIARVLQPGAEIVEVGWRGRWQRTSYRPRGGTRTTPDGQPSRSGR